MNRHHLYQLKKQSFKKQCEPRRMYFPRSLNLSELSISQINPGNPVMKVTLVQEKFQMPPGFLRGIVCFKMPFNT